MLLYTNVVTNNGPDASRSTTLTAALPGPVAFVLAQTTQGGCAGVTDLVCPLGTLAAGASATVTIAVQPRTPGEVSYSANVVGTPDPTGPGVRSMAPTPASTSSPPTDPPRRAWCVRAAPSRRST